MDKKEVESLRYQIILNRVSFSSKEQVLEVNQLDSHFIKSHDVILLKYCSANIKNDREAVLELVKVNGNNLRLLKHAFKDDKEIVLAALKSRPGVFQYTSKRFKEDDDLVHSVLESDPSQIMYCVERFKKDKELVCKLLKQNFELFLYIHPTLKNDLEIIFHTWEIIKDKFEHSAYSITSKASWLIEHMGDRMSPHFNQINFNSPLLVNQMDSFFSNLILNRELKKELPHSDKTQIKKVKI